MTDHTKNNVLTTKYDPLKAEQLLSSNYGVMTQRYKIQLKKKQAKPVIIASLFNSKGIWEEV